MNRIKLYTFIFIFFSFSASATFLSAQEKAADSISEKETSKISQTEEDLIHQGDLIDVDVIGSTEYDWRGTLSPEGNLEGINYTENSIFVRCRSETEVAAELEKSLGKILREPKIAVKILDRSNRPISFVYGAVRLPQRFRIKRTVRLNELLIVSGGLTDKASGEIQIFRPVNINCAPAVEDLNPEKEKSVSAENFVKASQTSAVNELTIKLSDLLAGKKEANPQVFGGDIITVLEAGSIYVTGGVAVPKQISLHSETTLSRALAAAGGLTKDAFAQKIIVSRKNGGERENIEIDFEKIKKKQLADFTIKPNDIIEVPRKGKGGKKTPSALPVVEPKEKAVALLPLRIID